MRRPLGSDHYWLRKLQQALSVSNAQPRNVEPLLKLAQILAIVGAAVWTVWLYVSHGRSQQVLLNEHQQLVNKQIELENQQRNALASSDRERALISVEQQRLDLAMKVAVADYETSQKKLDVAQRELALRQAMATSEFDIASAQLKAEALMLENTLKGVTLRDVTEGRIRMTADLSVELLSAP